MVTDRSAKKFGKLLRVCGFNCRVKEWRRVAESRGRKSIAIVQQQLSVPVEEIKPESNFIDDLKADSLDIVELGMAFEDKFGVSIPDEDYEKLKTVGDAVSHIKQRERVKDGQGEVVVTGLGVVTARRM